MKGLAEVHTRALESNWTLQDILSDKKVKGVDNLVARLHSTAGLAFKATQEINRLTAAVRAYNTEVGAARGIRSPFTQPGSSGGRTPKESVIPLADVTGKGGKVGDSIADSFLDKSAFFMLRYRMYSAALDAGFYTMNDILLGRSRQELAKGLADLSAVAFTSAQKKQTEYAAQQFSMRFWNTTTEEYVGAMSETASAFEIDKIGFSNLQRMNEAAIKLGKLSKMGAEQAADLMSGIVLQVMNRLPEQVRDALNRGASADVKGYGVTDIGGIAEKIAAQSAKAIQLSTVWGPGIAGAFKYMLPELMEKGWDVSAALAFLGATKSQGFPAEQIGRATKELFLSAPLDFARAMLMSTERWADETQGYTKAEAKELNEKRTKLLGKAIIDKVFSDPDKFQENMPKLYQFVKSAESKWGKFAVEDMGFSKYFMSVFRMMGQQGTMDTFKFHRQAIDKAEYSAMTEMVVEQLDDAGTAWMRISSSFTRFYQTMADSQFAHGVAKPVSYIMDFFTTYAQVPKLMAKLSREQGWSREGAIKHFDEGLRKPLEAMYGKTATDIILKNYLNKDSWAKQILGSSGVLTGPFLEVGYDFLREAVWGNREKIAQTGGNPWADITQPFEVMNTWGQKASEAVVNFFQTIIDYVRSFISFDKIAKWFNGDSGNQTPATELAKGWDQWFSEKMQSAKNYIFGPGQEVATQTIPDTDTTLGAGILQQPEKLPPLLNQQWPGYQPLSATPVQISQADEQPIQIENRLILDGRELAYVIAEIIQRNRATNYAIFGDSAMVPG